MPVEPAAQRLARILVLVPWVLAQGSPTVTETCARFGITPEELADDLSLLFCCGLPPFGPGDLIYAEIVGDRVVIDMADYLSRPPRLTRSEATMMLVMGRAVAALPGMEDAAGLHGAVGKLRAAIAPADASDAEVASDRVRLMFGGTGDGTLAVFIDAAAGRRRIKMSYYSASRDEMTEREIDPLAVFPARGEWYVVANDHASGEQRLFRVDRVRAAEPTGERFEAVETPDLSQYLGDLVFAHGERDLKVVIDLEPSAAWVREVVPHDRAETRRDGTIRLRLRTGRTAWLVSLLLTIGRGARAVEPPELVDEVRAAARAALGRYAQA